MKKLLMTITMFFLGFFSVSCIAAYAEIITVNTTQDNPKVVGSLRWALVAARPGDTINFAAPLDGQTIMLSGGLGPLTITKTLNITAQSLGRGIIINGAQTEGAVVVSDGTTVLLEHLTITGVNSIFRAACLNAGDLTLRNCWVHGNRSTRLELGEGAGIRSIRGKLTLDRTIVDQNQAWFWGGGISVHFNSELYVMDSTITNNFTTTSGGGIYHDSSGLFSIAQTIIARNTYGGIAVRSGNGNISECSIENNPNGGIRVVGEDANVTIDRCTISENGSISGFFGSGIANFGNIHVRDCLIENNNNGPGVQNGRDVFATKAVMLLEQCQIINNHEIGVVNFERMSISNCTIDNNSVPYKFNLAGGGVRNNGQLEINCSTISNNRATNGGGIFCYGNSSQTQLYASTVSGNTATIGNGGGISVADGAYLRLDISTLSGNTAEQAGGGLYVAASNRPRDLDISACTIAENVNRTQLREGGGVYIALQPSLNARIHNTIIATNLGAISGSDIVASVHSLGYNLVGIMDGSDGWDGVTDITGDVSFPVEPRLGPLVKNGGPTQTHALLKGSPAINTGDPKLANTQDQRGIIRDKAPDIGAYEVK